MQIFNYITISLLECLPLLFFFTNFLPYPLKKWQKLCLFSYFFLMHITFFKNLSQFSSPIYIIGSLIMITLFSKKKFLYNLLFAILGYLFGVCLDYMILSFLGLFDISILTLKSRYLYHITFCIFFSIIAWLATYHPGKLIRKKVLTLQFKLSNRLFGLLFFEVFICCAIFVLNIIICESLQYPTNALIFNSFLFFILFACTTLIFIKIIKTMKSESLAQVKIKEYKTMIDYTNQIENLYINLNQIRHDYPNIILSLHNFIVDKDLPALENYFFTKILPLETELSAMDSILKVLTNIKCIELKSILYTKLITAHNKNIKVSLYAPEVINQISMETLDLVRIMGIFLDNAIEASVQAEYPFLDVSILALEKSIKISISNSCPVEKIMLETIYNFGFSSKGASRGIGLHSALTILEQYENIVSKTTSENFCFSQELTIFENCI